MYLQAGGVLVLSEANGYIKMLIRRYRLPAVWIVGVEQYGQPNWIHTGIADEVMGDGY